MKIKTLQRGFTLIEIAIVLLAAAALAGIAVNAMTGMITNTRYALARSNFEVLKNGIIWNVVQNRVCAAPQVPPCNATTYTYTMPANNAAFVALGFSPQTANDPWGKPYTYANTTPVIGPPPLVLLPGTVVFTLASSGPDGIAGNADDISQIVYVLDVQSMLAKF